MGSQPAVRILHRWQTDINRANKELVVLLTTSLKCKSAMYLLLVAFACTFACVELRCKLLRCRKKSLVKSRVNMAMRSWVAGPYLGAYLSVCLAVCLAAQVHTCATVFRKHLIINTRCFGLVAKPSKLKKTTSICQNRAIDKSPVRYLSIALSCRPVDFQSPLQVVSTSIVL
jgi:hypothetical protein